MCPVESSSEHPKPGKRYIILLRNKQLNPQINLHPIMLLRHIKVGIKHAVRTVQNAFLQGRNVHEQKVAGTELVHALHDADGALRGLGDGDGAVDDEAGGEEDTEVVGADPDGDEGVGGHAGWETAGDTFALDGGGYHGDLGVHDWEKRWAAVGQLWCTISLASK